LCDSELEKTAADRAGIPVHAQQPFLAINRSGLPYMSDTSVSATYSDGTYLARNPDWHLTDAPGKARDVAPFLVPLMQTLNRPTFTIADVGAGVCGVLSELLPLLHTACPTITVRPQAFEPSADAVRQAHELFPTIPVTNRVLTNMDGPFDVVLMVDVLEHLENPRELLRLAHNVATHIVVRQPLLENFSTFRHRNYKNQRQTWGHIAYFNYYSFLDLTEDCGWQPLTVQLVPPWELATGSSKAAFWKRYLARLIPVLASYFLAPFYLIGSYRRSNDLVA
jgi:hypothetical protein